MYQGYEAIIGLEVHAQLKTNTKMFCSCRVVEDAEPNTHICPVCMGHPGTLPMVNQSAIDLAIRAGLAVGGTIHEKSVFSRKQYFYPDLPKGYQISQYDLPIITGGKLHVLIDGERRELGITRIHLEEDAGKSFHRESGTLVDYNRGGTPLIEIVSEADMRTPEEAEAYMRMLHRVLVEADITRGDMEKGNLRCDANISVHKPGTPWGTKVEVKNINSFRYVAKAIEHEIARQIEEIEAGGEIFQETRTWRGNETVLLRTKEGAADYRYFPEPDLPTLVVEQAEIDKQLEWLPGAPFDVHMLDQDANRFATFKAAYGLDDYVARVLLGNDAARALFEQAVELGGKSKAMANWIQGEVMRLLNEGQTVEGSSLTAESLVALQGLIDDGTISHGAGRKVFAVLWEKGGVPAKLVEKMGLIQVSDEGVIRDAVLKAIAANPGNVEKFKGGNGRMIGFFVGQVMKATQGKADPRLTQKILREELAKA